MRGRLCFLISFPKNYELFTQEKDGRTDHYLVGMTPTHVCCLGFRHYFYFYTRINIYRLLQISPGILSSHHLAYEREQPEARGISRLRMQIL